MNTNQPVGITIRGASADPDWPNWDDPEGDVDVEASRAAYQRLAEERIRERYPEAVVGWERGNGIHTQYVVDTREDPTTDDADRREEAIKDDVATTLGDPFDESDRWLCWTT